MKYRHLLIVPGLSSPFEAKHRSVYDLLEREALVRGFGSAETILLPGQINAQGLQSGNLSLPAAHDVLIGRLDEAQNQFESVRVVSLSFGCHVAMSALNKLKARPNLESVILWGVVPYWICWQSFIQGVHREKLGRGTRIVADAEFFHDIQPIETMLGQVDQRVVVGAGLEDQYSVPEFIGYLARVLQRALPPYAHRVSFSLLPGCSHNVDSTNAGKDAYLNLMFG